ncbi:MAG: DUF4303 domain-containing protein, partial [Verrucomicrobiota bacterium]
RRKEDRRTGALCAAFEKDVRSAWEAFQSDPKGRKPYPLVLYGVDGGDPYLWPAVLTEEGHEAVGQRYVDDGLMDTLEEACREVRFSVADAPDAFDFEDEMPAVTAELARLEKAAGEDGVEWTPVTEAAMEALSRLDQDGLFGNGTAREGLLLMVEVMDSFEDPCEESIRRLNSKSAYKRFKDYIRIEGVMKSCNGLAITPDGRHLFAVNNVPHPKRSGDDINEIVAYRLEGTTLHRLWAYNFPSFGDSVRDMAVTPDGVLWTVRLRYKPNGSSLIQQFSVESGDPIRELKVAEEPAAMAVARDGSKVALLTRHALLVVDASLALIFRVEFEERSYDVLFLQHGDLLVATDDGVQRVTSGGEVQPTEVTGHTFSLSLDAAESILAVGR